MGKRKERVTLSDQETKKAVTEFAEFILAKGDETGNDIIGRLPLHIVEPMTMAICAIALAKALAMLKDIGRRCEINIDKLYQDELRFFRRKFEKIPAASVGEKNGLGAADKSLK
ncbi:MAG: hypothetical protein K6A96_01330 [Prevotella sp.]|nr:hypothetical protein [Prevotella sp.]